jgi:phospholipid/cholesterol/gamma-HCH transport system ATP-binding protein
MPLDNAPVISTRNLGISFGDNAVLRGVELDVAPGENLAVLGRSGTGKSVLIKLIVGLLCPDSGTIQVLGQDVTKLNSRELDAIRLKIGFSFQSSALYDSMTVRENLEFPLVRHIHNLSRAEINHTIEKALDDVGLKQAIKQMPAELSGGQRKRIGIARTLMMKPDIMLYDEPTAGLDPITCTEINALIRNVQQRFKAAAIIITHDLTCAKAVGDRVAILADGKFQHIGTFDDVFGTDDKQVKQFYDYNFTK